jgi:hypothetical protein
MELNAKMLPLLAIPLIVAVLAGAAAYYFVTKDDGPPDLSSIRVEPGRVSCEVFSVAQGYRYTARTLLELGERPEGVPAEGGDTYDRKGWQHIDEIAAEVQGSDRIRARVSQPVDGQDAEYVIIGETVYFADPQSGQWTSQPLADSGFSVPYTPGASCSALAPDLRLSEMEGTPDTVNGIAATKYHFDSLKSDMPDRHPSFGPGSDAARYVDEFSGDVWVAQVGGYILKMDVRGTGHYETQRELHIEVAYELANVNEPVRVSPPI